MLRTNSPSDVVATGLIRADTGDGITATIPVTPPSQYAPPDTGWRDMTAGISPAPVSGALVLRRLGDTVWADFRALLGTAPSNSWYAFSGALPAGFRSPRNWQYISIPAWSASNNSPGPLRIATNGSIVIYNAKNSSGSALTVDGLVSWVTADAFPDPVPGSLVLEPRRALDVDPDFVAVPD